jgi:hypothetical protein
VGRRTDHAGESQLRQISSRISSLAMSGFADLRIRRGLRRAALRPNSGLLSPRTVRFIGSPQPGDQVRGCRIATLMLQLEQGSLVWQAPAGQRRLDRGPFAIAVGAASLRFTAWLALLLRAGGIVSIPPLH